MAERSFYYPAKNSIRDLWFDFVGQVKNPRRSSGLYLPAVENLELPGYQRLGFVPDNLIGCEHDPEIVPEIRRNAQGIRIIPGSISEGVKTIKQSGLPRLAFANLDFDGIYDTYVEEILSLFNVFPVSPAGYLAVTSYSARDDVCISQGAVNMCKFYAALGDQVRFLSDIGVITDRWRGGKRLLGSKVPDHYYVSRELGLLWWLFMVMTLVSYNGKGYGTIDRGMLKRMEGRLEKLSAQAAAVSKGKGMAFVTDDGLYDLLTSRSVQLWPTDFHHFIYYSQMSQPMRTWFFRICVLKGSQRTAQELLMQIWQLALRAPLVYIDDLGKSVTFG